MRALLLAVIVSSPALAGGGQLRFGASVGLGPAWGHAGNFPSARAIPLVPQTNYTAYGAYPIAYPIVYPIYYYQPQPPPPPPPPQVIIEREVIIERPAPPPTPPPQVIVIEHPAPVVAQQAPAPPPAPQAPAAVEPPKAAAPRTPGPDVYYWVDADGLVHYSTRAPANAKAKKLGTLAK